MPRFQVGDRVVKNPVTWLPSDFDGWGAGDGVGVVVEPPFPLENGLVDVVWPAGRCFRLEGELLPAQHQRTRFPSLDPTIGRQA